MAHYGIDVSSNNTHPINWSAAYNYLMGLDGEKPFAIIKINEGTYYTNPDALADIADARAAGFVVAGYSMTVGGEDPVAEQSAYRRVAGSLPEGFDVELPNGVSVAEYIQQTAESIALNPQALVYLNQSEVQEGFPTNSRLWLAEYNQNPGSVAFICMIHQYNNIGDIPGCSGVYDLNIWMGTEKEFNSFFGISNPVPAVKYSPLVAANYLLLLGDDMSIGTNQDEINRAWLQLCSIGILQRDLEPETEMPVWLLYLAANGPGETVRNFWNNRPGA